MVNFFNLDTIDKIFKVCRISPTFLTKGVFWFPFVEITKHTKLPVPAFEATLELQNRELVCLELLLLYKKVSSYKSWHIRFVHRVDWAQPIDHGTTCRSLRPRRLLIDIFGDVSSPKYLLKYFCLKWRAVIQGCGRSLANLTLKIDHNLFEVVSLRKAKHIFFLTNIATKRLSRPSQDICSKPTTAVTQVLNNV